MAIGLEPDRHVYATGASPFARVDGDLGESIVLGAHFDTVPNSPGANDNATGIAMILAAARFLAELECRQRSVMFVLFDQEEIGLVGSRAFAQQLVASGEDVVAVHTIDQMGWDGDGDRAVELERPSEDLFEVYAGARASGAFSIPLVQTQTGSTDHVAFREQGLAAIGLTEEFVSGDTTPHYHMASDTFATVNLDYLASTTELFLYTLARMVRGEIAAASRFDAPGGSVEGVGAAVGGALDAETTASGGRCFVRPGSGDPAVAAPSR
jgi:Zn-dependent M28 family amino/carboxypeptidase